MVEGKLWLDMVLFFFVDKMLIWIIKLLYFNCCSFVVNGNNNT